MRKGGEGVVGRRAGDAAAPLLTVATGRAGTLLQSRLRSGQHACSGRTAARQRELALAQCKTPHRAAAEGQESSEYTL